MVITQIQEESWVIIKDVIIEWSSSRPLCQCNVIKVLNKESIIKTIIVVVVIAHMVGIMVRDPHLELQS